MTNRSRTSLASALIFRTRFLARRFSPRLITKSSQLPSSSGRLRMSNTIFFELPHVDPRDAFMGQD
jgi:hypothetical protein